MIIPAITPGYNAYDMAPKISIAIPFVVKNLQTVFANNGACVPSISIYSPPRTIGVPI